MTTRYLIFSFLLATVFFLGIARPVGAQDSRERWHGDIRRFHEHDYDRWRDGRWIHGWHQGRRGWWWIVGGVWYFYPAPVYPYPDPFQPPPPSVAAPAYWYYCPNPAGYYPYVPRCRTPWQRVVPPPNG